MRMKPNLEQKHYKILHISKYNKRASLQILMCNTTIYYYFLRNVKQNRYIGTVPISASIIEQKK